MRIPKSTAHRLVIGVVVLLLGVPTLAQAQEGDVGILAIQNSVVMAYNLDTDDVGSGYALSVSLGVAPRVAATFSFVDGDGVDLPDHTLLKMDFTVVDQIGLRTSLGNIGGNPAVGTGLFVNLLEERFGEQLFAALRMDVEYLVDSTLGADTGILSFALGGRVGL